MRTTISLLSVATLLFASVTTASAQDGKFRDVSPDDFAAPAIEYLRSRNLIAGYEDNTFRPNQKVNRAEAVKLIASSIAGENEIKGAGRASFSDVPEDAWFAPYVAWAKKQGFVSGKGETKSFQASQTVTKAEFLKMLFLSRKIDLQAFGDITAPLATDVTSAKEWYFPVMRYGLATGVTAVSKNGTLGPAREVTRADAAVFLYRFFLSREGSKTQDLLLSAKDDLEKTLSALERGDLTIADQSSIRAVLSARGAHQFRPDEVPVKVAVKTAEGYRSLVQAYRSGLAGDLQKVVTLSSAAWKSGDAALKISPDASTLAKQLQKYAKSFADQARASMQ